MRNLMEYSEYKTRQLVEGVKIFENKTSALMFPSKEHGAFTIYGEADSTSHYDLEVGGNYKYNDAMNIEASLEFASNKAKYGENDERVIKYKEQSLKLGVTFVF